MCFEQSAIIYYRVEYQSCPQFTNWLQALSQSTYPFNPSWLIIVIPEWPLNSRNWSIFLLRFLRTSVNLFLQPFLSAIVNLSDHSVVLRHLHLSLFFQTFLRAKGRCTNDVCRERGGGGCPISDQRKGGCVDLVLTRGGRGSKIPKFWQTSFVHAPL